MRRRIYPNLAQYFKQSGDTQQAFADALGVAQPHISRIVNGSATPSLELAVRIAEKANIPVESLLSNDNSAQDHDGGRHA
jgi:transcriptional regulator with XRE-family HTH domain